ncbi:hypothetical protein COU60_01380 [Candidatus Pacearchaeota archaeon CG10_big_fil_rev_8_21_14_0_10_34_76]|nr:MAG: hypothetical protein COU60_01380 [Candidatus Pacearchaeota archaeon CG10_big_fil_rev_8_21_14_0_10_34_76]
MIDVQQQEAMLIAIGKTLPKKISVYAIGGTAMMFMGIKNSTLDIDFVFNKKNDREEFMDALRKLGAKDSDVTLIYGLKNNTPLMLEFSNCRFDMFMNKIITSTFSDAMKERSKQTHEFGNLIIKVANPHDILIMKSVTSRAKDLEDIIAIVNKSQIDWNIIVEEAKEQVKLGNEVAIMGLGEKLEKLTNQKAISVPKTILDKIWKLFNKQVREKVKVSKG